MHYTRPTLNSLKVPLKHLASDKPPSDFRSAIVNFSSVIIKRRFCVSSASSICTFKLVAIGLTDREQNF